MELTDNYCALGLLFESKIRNNNNNNNFYTGVHNNELGHWNVLKGISYR